MYTASFGKFNNQNEMMDYYFNKASSLLLIGAMDGEFCEQFYPFLNQYGNSLKKVVMVEPVPWYFNQLKIRFQQFPHFEFENSAISDVTGPCDFVTIDPTHSDIQRGGKLDWLAGCSMIGTEFKTEWDTNLLFLSNNDVEKYKQIITVNRMTISELFEKYDLNQIDIIKTDTEGHDWTILKQINLDIVNPQFVFMESMHLSFETLDVVEKWFNKHNYDFGHTDIYEPSKLNINEPSRPSTSWAMKR